MFQMIRPGRFKHRLLDADFLNSESMKLATADVGRAHTLFKSTPLPTWEWTALFIFILSSHRRPRDFFGGPHNEGFAKSLAKNSNANLSWNEVRKLVSIPLKVWERFHPDDSFFQIFCQHSLRSVPLSVQKSLVLWSQKNCLNLWESIPSSLEVLQMQSKGIRCVSVLTDPEDMHRFVDQGRDVLGFAVHDLIHADHFFADPAQTRAQIAFSKRLEQMHWSSAVQERIRHDIEFLSEWNYLISDMNSVPLHLFKTLKAIALASVKREFNIDFKQALHGMGHERFQIFMDELAKNFQFTITQKLAWDRINSPDFALPEDALTLEKALANP